MLEIHTDTNVIPGATYVALTGKIGIPEAADINDFIDEMVEADDVWLVVNLKSISFICSSGLGSLLGGVGKCREKGGDIIFIEMSSKIEMIFEFLDVMDYILYRPHVTDAARLITEIKSDTDQGINQDDLKQAVEAVKSGDIAAALPTLNNAIIAYPDDLQVLTWYGFALEQAGRTGEARSIYERVNTESSENTKAREFVESRLAHLEKSPFSDKNLEAALAGLQKVPPITTDSTSTTFYSTQRGMSGSENDFILTLGPWYAGDHDPLGNPLFGRNGGVYLWYGRKGIVIDPGRDFEDRFFKAGGNISDIDIIIVTSDSPTVTSSAYRILRNITTPNVQNDSVRINLIINPEAYNSLNKWYDKKNKPMTDLSEFRNDHETVIDAVKVAPVYSGDPNDADALSAIVIGGGEKTVIYAVNPFKGGIPVLPEWAAGTKTLLAVIGDVFREQTTTQTEPGLGFKETARLIRFLQPDMTLCLRIQGINQPLLFAETMSKSSEKTVVVPGNGWELLLEDYTLKNKSGDYSPIDLDKITLNDNLEINLL
ncbi:MAG: tetratricopeptide repeat protein [bacterium]|nr:tetratricopeptide repeat protein [bacterium]